MFCSSGTFISTSCLSLRGTKQSHSNVSITLKLYTLILFWACPKGRAIRYQSSHFLRQTVGQPLLSLTQHSVSSDILCFHDFNYRFQIFGPIICCSSGTFTSTSCLSLRGTKQSHPNIPNSKNIPFLQNFYFHFEFSIYLQVTPASYM